MLTIGMQLAPRAHESPWHKFPFLYLGTSWWQLEIHCGRNIYVIEICKCYKSSLLNIFFQGGRSGNCYMCTSRPVFRPLYLDFCLKVLFGNDVLYTSHCPYLQEQDINFQSSGLKESLTLGEWDRKKNICITANLFTKFLTASIQYPITFFLGISCNRLLSSGLPLVPS